MRRIVCCTLTQEITNSYQPGVIHRPDMSLYIYGEDCCRVHLVLPADSS